MLGRGFDSRHLHTTSLFYRRFGGIMPPKCHRGTELFLLVLCQIVLVKANSSSRNGWGIFLFQDTSDPFEKIQRISKPITRFL